MTTTHSEHPFEAQLLNPFTFPLSGAQLIEASAGTGKTWTIAALYVRLVLGHGEGGASGVGLVPPNILVVTFTEAATQELKDRIRSRLSEAARYFRQSILFLEQLGDSTEPEVEGEGDEFLQTLRAEYESESWAECAHKLERAAEWMDEAAVSTIHAWCYRMLRQHAFDTGSLFTQELEQETAPLMAEAARDYWRTYLLNLPVKMLNEIMTIWPSPTALQKAVQGVLQNLELIGEVNPQAIEQFQEACNKKWVISNHHKKAFRERWIDELERVLTESHEKGWVNRNQIRGGSFPKWIESLRSWSESETSFSPGDIHKRLTPSGFIEAWNGKAGRDPDLAPFVAFETMLEALSAAEAEQKAYIEQLYKHAVDWCARRFDELLRQRARLGFNELLTRLDQAMDNHLEWAQKGERAQRLIQRIREEFPVAMIDEFQDTDPIQYRIFESVYLDRSVEASQKERESCDPLPSSLALIMIGDPKQAIYAFRGADIYTYLQARRACGENLYTLQTNYRSSHAAVATVNALFERAEQKRLGAFLFKNREENPIPYREVSAKGRAERLIVQEGLPPSFAAALTLNHIYQEVLRPSDISKTNLRNWSSELCVERIVAMLTAGAEQPPTFGFSEDGETISRGVKPSDIAILVNTGHEAGIIQQALLRRGVRSVYLSEKESVYAVEEAKEIYYLLSACADPNQERKIKTALATSLLNVPFEEIDRLNRDEEALESEQQRFHKYQDLWRKKGVLPLLRRILNDFGVPARLLSEQGGMKGERILTNMLHLAELLQQASDLFEGEQALIRFLAEQIFDPDQGSESEGKLRLESDEELIKVVTIHKSKGLEYPLVFLPFAFESRVFKGSKNAFFKVHDSSEQSTLLFGENQADKIDQADHERLAEDLRKLYVALTRARYSTWIGLGESASLEKSAIGYLLWEESNDETDKMREVAKVTGDEIRHFERIPPFNATQGEIELEGVELIRVHQSDDQFSARRAHSFFRPPVDETLPPLKALVPERHLRDIWWVASYSSISRHAAPEELGEELGEEVSDPSSAFIPITAEEAQFDEDHRIAKQESIPLAPLVTKSPSELESINPTIHLFPGGTGVGNFLHAIFEEMAREGFGHVAEHPEILEKLVSNALQEKSWEAHQEGLVEWLHASLTTKLPLGDPTSPATPRVALADLAKKEIKSELEFWISASNVNLITLDRTVQALTLNGQKRPQLKSGVMNGMLKGFIDLLFVYEGRYYVLDYKSNRLGVSDEEYSSDAICAAILQARYDLQYVLYLFALHRLLKSRLPNYDYDTHVGGALYFFLRGIHGPSQGAHFEKPPRSLIDRLDALFSINTKGEVA